METGAVGFSRPKILNQVILGLFTLLSIHYLTEKAGDIALSVPVKLCLFHKLPAAEAGVQLKPGEPLSEEDKMKLAWASEMWITVELLKLLG